MINPLGEDCGDVGIGERIVDGLSVSAEFDQFHLLQNAKLVRDSALRHAQQFRDIADAQFPAGQCGENPDAGRVTECFEKISQTVQNFRIREKNVRAQKMVVMFVA